MQSDNLGGLRAFRPSKVILAVSSLLASAHFVNNIIILQAVEGRCMVLLIQKDCHEKMLSLLSDKNIYEPRKRLQEEGERLSEVVRKKILH